MPFLGRWFPSGCAAPSLLRQNANWACFSLRWERRPRPMVEPGSYYCQTSVLCHAGGLGLWERAQRILSSVVLCYLRKMLNFAATIYKMKGSLGNVRISNSSPNESVLRVRVSRSPHGSPPWVGSVSCFSQRYVATQRARLDACFLLSATNLVKVTKRLLLRKYSFW